MTTRNNKLRAEINEIKMQATRKHYGKGQESNSYKACIILSQQFNKKKHNKCEEVINMELGGGNRANKGILESDLDNQRA